MVTADATATGTALNTVAFFPPLRTSVSSGTVTHKSVPMSVRLANDTTGLNLDPTFYASFDLEFIEVF